jgi:hypothetical protein
MALQAPLATVQESGEVALCGMADRFSALRRLLDFNIPVGSDRIVSSSGKREIIVQGSVQIVVLDHLLNDSGEGTGAPVGFEDWDEGQEAVVRKELPAEGRYTLFSLMNEEVRVFSADYLCRTGRPSELVPLDARGAQVFFEGLESALALLCPVSEGDAGVLRTLLAQYRGFAGEALDHA